MTHEILADFYAPGPEFQRLLEIAKCAREQVFADGIYVRGVERAAAIAAYQQAEHGCGVEAQISAMQEIFRGYRIHNQSLAFWLH